MSCDAAITQTCHHRPISATAPRFAVFSKISMADSALPGAHPALQIANLPGQDSWKLFRTHLATEECIERLRSWPDRD